MNDRLQFPGGDLELPVATKPELLASGRDWIQVALDELAAVEQVADSETLVRERTKALRNALDHARRALREADGAQ